MFGKLTISGKLLLQIILVVITILSLSAVSLYSEHSTMMAEKQAKLRNIVEVVIGIAKAEHDRAAKGEITQDQARANTYRAMHAMHYDGSEYLFAISMQGIQLANGGNPKLEGKDMTGLTDSSGKHFILEFIDVVKKHGDGFVYYDFPRAGQTKPERKLSYIQGFAPWDMLVGTGIYLQDVDAQFYRSLAVLGGIGLAFLLVVGGLGALTRRDIRRSLDNLGGAMQTLAGGDTGVDIAGTARQDEIGVMARTVEVFKANAIEKIAMEQRQEEERKRFAAEREAQEARFQQVIGEVVVAAAEGDLTRRVDTAGLAGVLQNIGNSVNALLARTEEVLGAVTGITSSLAEGDLRRKIEVRYGGRFGMLVSDINTMGE